MNTFNNLGIPEKILNTLTASGYINPTPIQEQVIPLALAGHDVLGNAQTGTGKTAAFAVPAIAHLMKNSSNIVLILLPTRELAAQVLAETTKIMGKSLKIPTALLIGGDSVPKQLKQINMGARLIVGTPGRINDHLRSRKLRLGLADMLILDETDRMLDMGFGKQLESIISEISPARQTLMLSATMPKNIMELAGKYLRDPKRVSVDTENTVTDNVTQELIETTDELKYSVLTELLDKQPSSVLIFTKTKYGAERLSKRLLREKFLACVLHGDLSQAKRERAIREFKSQKCIIMVATDIAARGLDISHIDTVINYDLPQAAEDYIHRIGRTGRAGRNGVAINLLTKNDHQKWRDICKLLKTECGLPDAPREPRAPSTPGKPRAKRPYHRRPKRNK
ncbi:DEAD/DEAH box helicase [Lachnospiraceae bacterium OttesenSCG-928-E19]|nr:DEAD/DEAH box helicase [Lachnospiraceae bacterium OttesenSCG-928-E19]